jgi:hypothetical protein
MRYHKIDLFSKIKTGTELVTWLAFGPQFGLFTLRALKCGKPVILLLKVKAVVYASTYSKAVTLVHFCHCPILNDDQILPGATRHHHYHAHAT